MTRKIILDVDTGSDDAVAIMLAALSKDIDLQAICTVAGNQDIDSVTANTLKVVDLLGMDIPVYRGCTYALVREACPWRIEFENRATAVVDGKEIHIHPDFVNLPDSKRQIEKIQAPIFYVNYLMGLKEKITLVCVGPLTNLATALLIEPKIVEHIDEIVIMGGGHNESNASSSSEFNIFRDPEAAQRVFNCGVKITLVPLDVTHRTYVTKTDLERLKALNNPCADFAINMCEQRILIHNIRQPLAEIDACALHDPLCIAYLIDPSVLTDVRFLHVDISLTGLTDGQTVVDMRYFQDNRNCFYAFDGDRKKYFNIIVDAFKNASN